MIRLSTFLLVSMWMLLASAQDQTWRDAQGKKHFNGMKASVSKVTVTVKLPDGKLTQLSVRDLSEKDIMSLLEQIAPFTKPLDAAKAATIKLERSGARVLHNKAGKKIVANHPTREIVPEVFGCVSDFDSVYSVEFGPMNSTAEHLDALEPNDSIQAMTFFGMDDEMCSMLERFENLKTLKLYKSSITRVGVNHLSSHGKIDSIHIGGSAEDHQLSGEIQMEIRDKFSEVQIRTSEPKEK